MLAAVIVHQKGLFTYLLLACFLSDILDGLIARVFRLRSHIGAFLDSTADMIVFVISIAGVIVFQRDFLQQHAGMVAGLTALYFVQAIAAFFRYGRISSFHTVATRVAAYTEAIFLMSLFLWGYGEWLFYIMVAAVIVALSEEMALLYFLPQWRSDVRGLYWVWRERNRTHA